VTATVRATARPEHERRLDLFGTKVRLLVGPPAAPGTPSAKVGALAVECMMRTHHRRLTRFDPDSELSRLNRDPRESVPVSSVLACAVRAALQGAELTAGLVDPTLERDIVRAGYAESLVGARRASLHAALRAAPARRPARARPDAAWRAAAVTATEVRRPPRAGFDLGGSAKGHAADLAARLLAGSATFAVDVGGDIVLGGRTEMPRGVEVEHPLDRGCVLRFAVAAGAVATSGIANRVWRSTTGFAHHLLDPSTGEPAWTGVIQATALADSGVEAEALAKAALLAGPEGGRRILERRGGALVLDDGTVQAVALPLEAQRCAA
jgi:thiamine biosynthesis lipoprotein